jgi:hypothetical protein
MHDRVIEYQAGNDRKLIMSITTAKVPLLLPVENQVRELDSKILLALFSTRYLSIQKHHCSQRYDVPDNAQPWA